MWGNIADGRHDATVQAARPSTKLRAIVGREHESQLSDGDAADERVSASVSRREKVDLRVRVRANARDMRLCAPSIGKWA